MCANVNGLYHILLATMKRKGKPITAQNKTTCRRSPRNENQELLNFRLKQDRQVGFGPADGAQAYFGSDCCWQHDVQRTDLGHLFEEFSWRGAQATAVHPLLKGAPHHQGQKTHEDVRQHPVGRLGLSQSGGKW